MAEDNNLTELQEIFDSAKASRERIDADGWAYLQRVSLLPEKVEEYDAEFERLTGINHKDWGFVVFASVLQCVRVILSDLFKTRLSDKQSAEKTPFHNNDEHTDRTQKRYYATIEEIDRNPVPFDTVLKSPLVKRNHPNLKLSGMNHRFKTAGHDPLMGLIFGTANIMTKTVTINVGAVKYDTYHVQSQVSYLSKLGNPVVRDVISNGASTELMFAHIIKRLKQEGKDGWRALGHALTKELVHLASDVRTEHSLPLPFVSSASPNLARVMQACGLDTFNATMFGIDMLFTKWINFAITLMHSMAFDDKKDGDRELYDVRTKRIVLLSNEIMMTCSTVMFAARICMGDLTAGQKFDFGGSAVALKQIWTVPEMIEKVKHEYISNKLIQFLNQ